MFSQLNSLESVQLLLSCLVAVFCLPEVSQFCFDRSVVTLFRRPAVTPPSPPLIFYSQCFPFTLTSQVTANTVFLVNYVGRQGFGRGWEGGGEGEDQSRELLQLLSVKLLFKSQFKAIVFEG